MSAFTKLNEELVKRTHLYFPDLMKAFHMHMYASGHAIGVTPSQQDDNGDLCLVTCVSRKLNPSERNYPT